MPSVSEKQRRFMAAAAHDPKFAKAAGIPVAVAQEFHQADAGKSYGAGGIKAPTVAHQKVAKKLMGK